MAIALTEQVLGFDKALADTARRHDHVRQGQALTALNEKLIGRVAVMGIITEETVDPDFHLIQKIRQDRDVADIMIRKVGGDIFIVIRINADMEFLPGRAGLACRAFAETLPLPLAWAIDFQPGAVDLKIQAVLARGRSRQPFKATRSPG